MTVTVSLGVEREKISQYVLEKLLLFFFSLSDPVSLRMKPRTGRAGEAEAARSDPSWLLTGTPVPSRWGDRAPLGQRVAVRWDRSQSLLHPRGTASLTNAAAQATPDLVPLLKCRNSDKLVIFLQSAKSQWISHKPCSKGHILPALICVLAVICAVPALISGDLLLWLGWWDACPRSGVGSGGSILGTPILTGTCLRAASHPGKKSDLQLIPHFLLNLNPAKAGQRGTRSQHLRSGVTTRCSQPLLRWDPCLLLPRLIISLHGCCPKGFTAAGPTSQAHMYDDFSAATMFTRLLLL